MKTLISKIKQAGRFIFWCGMVIAALFVFSTMQGCASYRDALKDEFIRGYTGRYPDEKTDCQMDQPVDSTCTSSETATDTIEVKVSDDRWIIDPNNIDEEIPSGEELIPNQESIDEDD